MTTPGKWFNRAIAFAGVLLSFASTAVASEILPPGFRPLPLGVHALVGGRVVVKPGETLETGTIVIRDGLIQAVGKDAAVPADARIWDMNGTTIYAGFIEPYLVPDSTNAPISTSAGAPIATSSFTAGGVRFFGAPGDRVDMGNPGAGNDIAKITPEFHAIDKYSPKEKSLAPLRELGFTTGVIAPAKGIIRGTSALVSLVEENPNRTVVRPDVFQHIAFETDGNDSGAYPDSLMGVIAAIRQSFFDAQHYALDHADYARHPQDRRRPQFDPSLEALKAAANKNISVAFEPGSALMDDRAAQISAELGLDFCLVSSGQEWRRPDLAAATGATFIVPLNFPTLPKLPDEEDWDQVSLDQLRAWDWAAENPALLRRQGREIALTTYGLSDKKDFRRNLRLALDRGLSETDALAALTTLPAKLCGVQSQLGTIEAGKFADLTIVEGTNYFDPDAKIRAVWIDGRIYPSPPEEAKSKAGEVDSAGLGTATALKEEPEKTPRPPSVASQTSPAAGATNAPPESKSEEKKERKKDELRELQKTRVARSPLDDRGFITNPPAVLIHNATIWTCSTNGVLVNEDLLVVDGKIKALGRSSIAEGVGRRTLMIVDGSGLHVTPGIIDCHSHTAILGDVNEAGLPCTAMVRISDVVNSETENFHQQLAGGVTMVNLLHGSANAIGGQNCVIKLRDGDSPEQLIFSNAPAGIKFALGENVKQSNWGEKFVTRFPQSRTGVRTFIQNRFIAAQTYLKEWADYQSATNALVAAPTTNAAARIPVPPRRDLELEAIGEVIQGKRLIHCHSYRQDEILMLLRLMPEFGVQIGTFQHVLEGYKIADEIAQHGAGGSTFSDWWAYKFEVYDAIPYNGSLMRERGVVVSFNSDSSELARRLYLEAAKAVKYGDTPQTEALNFVTLNPAKQLRIDQYVGSLEPGKDADFAIWSKSPLASDTVCLQTWIDGKKYFDRALETDRTARLQKERDDLIARSKKIAKLAAGEDDKEDDDGRAFFRAALEHQFDRVDRDCMGEAR
jgi:imidazolonepropionase-like amidohydrolase